MKIKDNIGILRLSRRRLESGNRAPVGATLQGRGRYGLFPFIRTRMRVGELSDMHMAETAKTVTWASRCWGERRSGANQFGSLRFILFAFFGARLNQKSSVCLQFSEVGFRASCRLSWHRPFLMPSSPISQKIKRKKRLIPKGIFDFFYLW